jgi:hypothetical protein
MENPSRPTTFSEPITHEKSDRKHTMELNQSNEGQRKKPTLNNPHPFRQDSGGGDDFTKAPKPKNGGHNGDDFTKAPKPKNGGPRKHFTKAPNIRNGGLKKQAKTADITHHKDPNRTEKAWWRPPANEVQKRPRIQEFSDGQYGFSHQGMQHTSLGQKRELLPERKLISTAFFEAYSDGLS